MKLFNSMKKILVIVESLDINDSSGTKGRISLIKNLFESGFQLRVCHYTRNNIDQKLIGLENLECVSIPEKKFNLLYLLSRTERVFTRLTKINLNPYLESWFGFSFTFFNDTNSIVSEVKKTKRFSTRFDINIE